MQKVLRRTALAKAQHARKALKLKQKAEAEDWVLEKQELGLVRKENSKILKDARRARREDWELGPLAPRRDIGDLRDVYATVDSRRLRAREEKEKRKFQMIVANDRVVVIEGKDKGKIGRVLTADPKSPDITVRGLNKVDIEVPEYMKQADSDKRAVRSLESPIPLSSVRLVHPLIDPETGNPKDVVIKKLVPRDVFDDKRTGEFKFARVIPGLNIEIPFPEKAEPEEKDEDIDTLRVDVEAKTWVPTLLRPPMPETVIDELRNKYSVFRDRHDEEYIARKMAEDAEKEEKKKSIALMRTPINELNRKLRKERKAKKGAKIPVEVLAKIGEVMAAKKGLSENKATLD